MIDSGRGVEYNIQTPGVKLYENLVHSDGRGYLTEIFNHDRQHEDFEMGAAQVNFTHSVEGALRGLHFQEVPQGKLIRVVKGCIFDVAVDLRKNSSTFAKYSFAFLSDLNRFSLWIPQGFAHGFFSISSSDIVYVMDQVRLDTKQEHCLHWNDRYLDIPWPRLPTYISERDKAGKSLSEIIDVLKGGL